MVCNNCNGGIHDDTPDSPLALDSELEQFVIRYPGGLCRIKHPLLTTDFEVGNPDTTRYANHLLQIRRDAINLAINQEDFFEYVFIHERGWMLNALIEIMDMIEDDAEFERILTAAWKDEHEKGGYIYMLAGCGSYINILDVFYYARYLR